MERSDRNWAQGFNADRDPFSATSFGTEAAKAVLDPAVRGNRSAAANAKFVIESVAQKSEEVDKWRYSFELSEAEAASRRYFAKNQTAAQTKIYAKCVLGSLAAIVASFLPSQAANWIGPLVQCAGVKFLVEGLVELALNSMPANYDEEDTESPSEPRGGMEEVAIRWKVLARNPKAVRDTIDHLQIEIVKAMADYFDATGADAKGRKLDTGGQGKLLAEGNRRLAEYQRKLVIAERDLHDTTQRQRTFCRFAGNTALVLTACFFGVPLDPQFGLPGDPAGLDRIRPLPPFINGPTKGIGTDTSIRMGLAFLVGALLPLVADLPTIPYRRNPRQKQEKKGIEGVKPYIAEMWGASYHAGNPIPFELIRLDLPAVSGKTREVGILSASSGAEGAENAAETLKAARELDDFIARDPKGKQIQEMLAHIDEQAQAAEAAALDLLVIGIEDGQPEERKLEELAALVRELDGSKNSFSPQFVAVVLPDRGGTSNERARNTLYTMAAPIAPDKSAIRSVGFFDPGIRLEEVFDIYRRIRPPKGRDPKHRLFATFTVLTK